MARVIADIGSDLANNSPAIVGVSEIENHDVLEDGKQPFAITKGRGIVHDSPDNRGIDVGLIYQKDIFRPVSPVLTNLKFTMTKVESLLELDQLLVMAC